MQYALGALATSQTLKSTKAGLLSMLFLRERPRSVSFVFELRVCFYTEIMAVCHPCLIEGTIGNSSKRHLVKDRAMQRQQHTQALFTRQLRFACRRVLSKQETRDYIFRRTVPSREEGKETLKGERYQVGSLMCLDGFCSGVKSVD